ncbi:hypothetical protein AYI68_g7797 [Smittium mucronatum]|uniref:Uncharacterized protein n=1 Tax=Smittium mucronatum TaxID=133383 RepID=A0A1R0GMN9_9FUNG|nr:hypothetical protein AYI68_g7797 [Smittium mucronatum]
MAQKFIPTSLMEIVTGGVQQKKIIATMGGTHFKLGCHLKNIEVELGKISMGIVIQIPEIQMCYEIDSRRRIPILKFKN